MIIYGYRVPDFELPEYERVLHSNYGIQTPGKGAPGKSAKRDSNVIQFRGTFSAWKKSDHSNLWACLKIE